MTDHNKICRSDAEIQPCTICGDLGIITHGSDSESIVFPEGLEFRNVEFSHVKSASTNGCLYCSFILTIIDQFYPDIPNCLIEQAIKEDPSQRAEYECKDTWSLFLKSGPQVILEIRSHESPPQVPGWPHWRQKHWIPSWRRELDIYGIPDSPCPLKYLPDIKADPASEECFAHAKGWVETCVREHEECRISATASSPRRLLDVKAGDGSEIILLETDGNIFPYAALSHCWGKRPLFKTETHNIDAQKAQIAWEKFPHTFQDAIIVTRGLNIRYLWIDALCIVQDDTADWEREAAKMCDVYQNAVVTIAGADSAGSHECFLKPRTEYLSKQLVFPSQIAGLPERFVKVRESLATIYPQSHITSDRISPISERAWCFQESLLATRYLAFERREMRWECRRQRDCECGAHNLAPYEKDSLNQTSLGAKASFVTSTKKADAEVLFRIWKDFVIKEYSRRDLTRVADLLPALSGVAASFRLNLQDEYLAGLWKKDLARQLCWILGKNRSNDPYPDVDASRGEVRAPSWSWASVRGDIAWHVRDAISAVNILEAKCIPTGQNELGTVGSGTLRLSGRAVQATLTVEENGFLDAWSEGLYSFRLADGREFCVANQPRMNGGEFGERHWKLSFWPDAYLRAESVVSASGKRDTVLTRCRPQDGQDGISGSVVIFLACEGAKKKNEHLFCCLVLAESAVVRGAYERIGYIFGGSYKDSRQVVDQSDQKMEVTVV
ncbi:HET-domain-containing protein [Rhizodiscina lignyota]|uniref:HET-domain-containing protein n=1 Tax=Rhizodiscina lignyota TaxID=1504668 RepID=A0A9P4IDG9_9PEZI|nr:HET-domain-containing protein [Rhizodiscina lignyota]